MVPKRGKGRNKLWLLLKKRHHRSLGWERRMGDGKVGQVVHHKDHNKKNTKKSNLKLVSKPQHNKEHPEKGGHHPKGSGKRRRKRK
jgi:hypothetical protein